MLAAILAGLCSGVISGMGIGGGTILIPALAIFLKTAQHQIGRASCRERV